MNALKTTGAILMLLGVLALAIPVLTTRQTVDLAKVGDLKLQTTEDRSTVIPPWLGFGALGLGAVLIGAGFFRQR
jgi:dipeptide/tripeptide permease